MNRRKLIIGLGNPDPLLENTYHNVGVMALEKLTKEPFKRYKDLFEYAEDGDEVYIKPLVFMNESGRAVHAAAKVFEASAEGITIMHDESDLPLGEVKFSEGQGSAGHRGVQSVIDALGSKEFKRVRIGIRNMKERTRKKASEFVLKPVKSADKKILEKVFETIALKTRGESHRE